MTFEAGGRTRVGLVLGARVFDIDGANRALVAATKVAPMAMPADMKSLIEQYARVAPRLYQIANHVVSVSATGQPFAFDANAVKVLAPIKYPWNLMAASANYKAHAEGMGVAGAGGAAAPPPAAQAASPAAPARPAAGLRCGSPR